MKKKRIVKSCSFDDTLPIQRFVNSQKNFSRSIRLLILDYINRNNGKIDDVYENCGLRRLAATGAFSSGHFAAYKRPVLIR